MPVHELNPVAVANDGKIFYISSEWKMYVFNTSTTEWSLLSSWETISERLPSEMKAKAIFSAQTSCAACFAVVGITDNSIKIPLLHIRGQEVKLCTNVEEIAGTSNDFSYAGSVMVNRKLVVFLTCEKTEDAICGEGTAGSLHKMVMFDPDTNSFCDLPNVQNVRRALSVLVLPHLPSNFTIGTMDVR